MNLKFEVEQETDGRWIAEVMDLPGVMAMKIVRRKRSPESRLWL